MAGGVGAFAGMQFGSMAGMGNVFGGGCQKMDSIKIPSVRPQWTCGLESTGKWTCAGECQCNECASVMFACVGHHHAVQCIKHVFCSSCLQGPRRRIFVMSYYIS